MKKRRAGQVEVRQQRVDRAELEARRDEEIRREAEVSRRPAASGRRAAASSERATVVPTATTRRPSRLRRGDRGARRRRDRHVFRGHRVCAAVSSTVTGLKVPAPTASVRSAISTPRARDRRQDLLREVEAGGRRRDGAAARARRRSGRRRGPRAGRARRARGGCRAAGECGRCAASSAVVERAVEDERSGSAIVVRPSTTSAARPSSKRIRRPDLARRPGLASALQRLASAPCGAAGRSRRAAPRRRGRRACAGPDAARRCARADRPREEAPAARRSGGARSRRLRDSSTSRRLVAARPRLLRDPLGRQVVVEEVDAHVVAESNRGTAGRERWRRPRPARDLAVSRTYAASGRSGTAVAIQDGVDRSITEWNPEAGP